MAPCLQLDLRLRCTRPFLAGSWVWNLILRYVGVNITAVTTPIVFGHVTDPATVSIGDCAIIDRNALVHGHLMQLSGLQFSPTSIRPCNHVVTSSAATSCRCAGGPQSFPGGVRWSSRIVANMAWWLECQPFPRGWRDS